MPALVNLAQPHGYVHEFPLHLRSFLSTCTTREFLSTADQYCLNICIYKIYWFKMDALNVASSLVGIIDVAGKTIYKLHSLNSLWNSAPEEVTRLTNTLDSLRRLLDSLRAPLAAGQLVGPGQTPGDLVSELAMAEETLEQLESILTTIHGEQGTTPALPATISHPSAKARWAIHRKTLLGLHSRLHDHLQRIMTRLQLMNMYVKCLPIFHISFVESYLTIRPG